MHPMPALHEMGMVQGAELIRSGALSPVEWVSALLERISALDPQINAFLHVCGEEALGEARQAGRDIAAGHEKGPLHGVPYVLKDMIDTAGIPSTAQSRLLRGRIPAHDASVVTALRRQGAILLGKVATHEFAHGGPSPDILGPPARNPWNIDHFTGSSSSGSGAAVAAGFAPFALGTDTGGSIRIPAGMCGIAGLKPSFGLVSKRGVIPLSHSLDACGPMAWSSRECGLILNAIAGHDPVDPSSSTHALLPSRITASARDLAGVRIGVIRHFWERDLAFNPEAVAAMEEALATLRGLGAHLRDVTLRSLQQYNDVRVIVQEPEAFAIHQRNLIDRADEFGADFLARILPSCGISAHLHMQANRERGRMVRQMAELFHDHDLLVSIGAGPAPRFDTAETFGAHNALWVNDPMRHHPSHSPAFRR